MRGGECVKGIKKQGCYRWRVVTYRRGDGDGDKLFYVGRRRGSDARRAVVSWSIHIGAGRDDGWRARAAGCRSYEIPYHLRVAHPTDTPAILTTWFAQTTLAPGVPPLSEIPLILASFLALENHGLKRKILTFEAGKTEFLSVNESVTCFL